MKHSEDGWEQWFGGFPRTGWDGLKGFQMAGLEDFQGLDGMVWRISKWLWDCLEDFQTARNNGGFPRSGWGGLKGFQVAGSNEFPRTVFNGLEGLHVRGFLKRKGFFLICRRARRQRSQSPILVTVRIDKHFKLYIDWSLRKIKEFPISLSRDEVDEQIPFNSPISNEESGNFTIQLLKNGHHS